MAVAAIAPVVGDLIGRALASGDREAAEQLLEQARRQFNIPIPTLAELEAQVGPSALQQAKADPEAVEAQRMALQDLQRMAHDGGGIEYRAGIERVRRDVGRDAAARDAALQQQMSARGLGGSGIDFATRAVAGQGAADREAAMGFESAADANRMALLALQGQGALASQMRGQSWGEERAKGDAADEINKFNAMQRSGAFRDRFGMQMGLGTAKANQLANQANVKTGQAAQTQNQWGNYGVGAGMAAANVGQYAMDEERRKRAQAGGY
ncbi:MAG TPA: hypothetical protein VMY76_00720 [Gemmatimonadales bacterium]|nr:hypothetical protein [Gemmatimonadales bacterium]